jgi:hypothetical protein
LRQSVKLLPESGSDGARALGLTVLGVMVGSAIITVAGVLLCFSFFRYEFAAAGNDPAVYRFDRWDGDVTVCLAKDKNPLHLICTGQPGDYWENVPAK